MPTLYSRKPGFQARIRPLLGRLARAGATPNQLTLAALAGSALLGAALARNPASTTLLLLYPLALVLRMALNALDGMLAREHGMATRAGAVLNEAGDILADLCLYLPLAGVAGVPAVPLQAAVAVGVLTEVAALGVSFAGGERRHDGPLGKSDRAVAFGALAVALVLVPPDPTLVGLYLGALTALGLATARTRFVEGRAR